MVSTFSRQDQNYKNDDLNQPSKDGRFGKYGGQYVPETLMPALFELETAASNAWKDKLFVEELNHLLKTYVGRETHFMKPKDSLNITKLNKQLLEYGLKEKI